MKTLAVIVLGIVMLTAGFVGVASAQVYSKESKLTPFSPRANYMSQAGYSRYVNHQQTGQWMPFTQ